MHLAFVIITGTMWLQPEFTSVPSEGPQCDCLGRQSVRGAARDEGDKGDQVRLSRDLEPGRSLLVLLGLLLLQGSPVRRWFRGFERGKPGLCGGRESVLPAIWTIGTAWYGLIPGELGPGAWGLGNVDTV